MPVGQDLVNNPVNTEHDIGVQRPCTCYVWLLPKTLLMMSPTLPMLPWPSHLCSNSIHIFQSESKTPTCWMFILRWFMPPSVDCWWWPWIQKMYNSPVVSDIQCCVVKTGIGTRQKNCILDSVALSVAMTGVGLYGSHKMWCCFDGCSNWGNTIWEWSDLGLVLNSKAMSVTALWCIAWRYPWVVLGSFWQVQIFLWDIT